MSGEPRLLTLCGGLWLACLLGLTTGVSMGQSPPPPSSSDAPDFPQVADSGVGYIDTAIVASRLRLRFDAAYDNDQPARAEFFWPVGAPLGPGPGQETSVDYQDISPYVEVALVPGISVFGELPVRLVDPELNDNTAGLSDANFGFKAAICSAADEVLTFQFRTYVPIGDASRGLGNDHVSLEPAVLWYRAISPRVVLEAELRDWIAVDGTDDFAGNVLRYGVGASYLMTPCSPRPVRAVAEIVGWTVLDGRTSLTTAPGLTIIEDAGGDTIVNAKLGLRWLLNPCTDLYAGYGRALTGDVWYKDTLRVELRQAF